MECMGFVANLLCRSRHSSVLSGKKRLEGFWTNNYITMTQENGNHDCDRQAEATLKLNFHFAISSRSSRDSCCRCVERRERKEFIILYTSLDATSAESIKVVAGRKPTASRDNERATTSSGGRKKRGKPGGRNEMKSNPARCLRCLAVNLFALASDALRFREFHSFPFRTFSTLWFRFFSLLAACLIFMRLKKTFLVSSSNISSSRRWDDEGEITRFSEIALARVKGWLWPMLSVGFTTFTSWKVERKKGKKKNWFLIVFSGHETFCSAVGGEGESEEKGLRKIQIITSDDLVSFSKVAPLPFTVVCAENMLKLFISQRSKKERVEKKRKL